MNRPSHLRLISSADIAPVPGGGWFPSSKTCSCCGVVKPTLALNERHFACADCGFEADRDLNAALNLKTMADSLSVSACGEIRSGAERKPRVKRASMKQEETPEIREPLRNEQVNSGLCRLFRADGVSAPRLATGLLYLTEHPDVWAEIGPEAMRTLRKAA